jgi:hypothetical protein
VDILPAVRATEEDELAVTAAARLRRFSATLCGESIRFQSDTFHQSEDLVER